LNAFYFIRVGSYSGFREQHALEMQILLQTNYVSLVLVLNLWFLIL